MEWLISNPEKQLSDCAAAFNLSRAWLSTIIHSDIFRARYGALLQDHIDERILPLRDLVVGVTTQALEGLSERLQIAEAIETSDLKDVASMGLKSLGYGAAKPAPPPSLQINIHSSVTPEELKAARELYHSQVARRLEPVTLDGAVEPSEPETPHELPSP